MGVTNDRVGIRIRDATPCDLGFLWDMLYEAASRRPERVGTPRGEILSNPEVSHYLDGWGRPEDFALLAMDPYEDRRIGAAWYRLFPPEDPAYGFVDAATPEVAVAAVQGYRGRGVGRTLLNALADAARSRGFDALSLSVEQENPAAILYERLGYEKILDRGNAWKMRLDLGSADSAE